MDAARWAQLLRTHGCGQGDRVLVMLGKVPAWLGVMLGAVKAGLVTVPCSEMLRARDLAFRAQDSRARLIVADRASEGEVDAMRGLLDEPIGVALSRRRGAAPATAAADSGHRGDPLVRRRVHPLHVGDDEGAERGDARARLPVREAHAGRVLAGRAAG